MRKILVGYDGSPAAEGAIDDLAHACIAGPVEALVLCAADVWLPPEEAAAPGPDRPQAPDGHSPGSEIHAKARAVFGECRATAARGADRLARQFPAWRVDWEARADSPGWALTEAARNWRADLIVLGAHSHSAFERFFFGSAASRVLQGAPCSVRISRPRRHLHHPGLRLMLAVDGSRDSGEAAVEVSRRSWPAQTEIRVVTVLDPGLESRAGRPGAFEQLWLEEHFQGARERISAIAARAAETLRASGLAATHHIFDGDPKKVLLHEAEGWQADCLFLGARGLDHRGRWPVGSVASALASRAHCSVEIIRCSRERPPDADS